MPVFFFKQRVFRNKKKGMTTLRFHDLYKRAHQQGGWRIYGQKSSPELPDTLSQMVEKIKGPGQAGTLFAMAQRNRLPEVMSAVLKKMHQIAVTGKKFRHFRMLASMAEAVENQGMLKLALQNMERQAGNILSRWETIRRWAAPNSPLGQKAKKECQRIQRYRKKTRK